MRRFSHLHRAIVALIAAGATAAGAAAAQTVEGEIREDWYEGAEDCEGADAPALEHHAYEPQTHIVREGLCHTFEAPLIYLMIGEERALLIDTGAIASPEEMPLAETVLALLPEREGGRLPLTVVHSHGHGDHKAGDGQFAGLEGVEVVPATLDAVREYFGFEDWPEGAASIDLGGRVVHAIPAPGHHETHVVYYDERTGVLFTGDFLLPGRLLIDDAAVYGDSAARVAAFVKNRPVARILGAHIELNEAGKLFPWGSTHHPNERRMDLAKEDLAALPQAFAEFNGFYNAHPNYALTHSMHILSAIAGAALLVLAVLVWIALRLFRRRKV